MTGPTREKMTAQCRIDSYVMATKYPKSLFVGEDGRIVGTWIMGNAYGVPSGYYGGYPHGYLYRIRSLFPDKSRALHVFSGRVDQSAWPGDTVDLDPSVEPTFLDDAQSLEKVDLSPYDIILADPPYSVEDSEHYKPTMVKRNKVMDALSRVQSNTHVVWLDQVLPMYRKADWEIEGVIGMVKSTNHRFRVIVIFRKR